MIDLLIPCLGRPQNAQTVVDSIHVGTELPHTIVFICSRGDDAQIAACIGTGAVVLMVDGGDYEYARKINHAATYPLRADQHPWLFLGADDLHFHKGWDHEAVAEHERTGKLVIGTNDCANPTVMSGAHATHSLVHRRYVTDFGTIDEPGLVLYPGYHHNFCNPPEAPIWMADCSFKPLGGMTVGDVVIGWERIEAEAVRVGTPRRSLCYSTVVNVQSRIAPLVHVVMESGREFRCTPDHYWLNASWNPGSRHNAQFVVPRVGRNLLHVIDEPEPVAQRFERTAGWLAGIYDGEGSGIVVATQSVLRNPSVFEEIKASLDRMGVNYRLTIRPGGVAEFVLNGGRQEYLNFLLRIGPTRRESLAAHVVGWRSANTSRLSREPIGARRFGHKDKIAAVDPIQGETEVISLTTSSGNYVAWGYASRNCDNEFVGTAQHRGEWSFAYASHVQHQHPIWGTAKDDRTYELGRRTYHADSRTWRKRRRLWR